MEIGKLSYFYLLIHLYNHVVHILSQMEIQIVQDVLHHNVDKNVQKVFLMFKLQEMMFVVILVFKMVAGKKEFIQEFIEILELLKL
jgi:hypothetical protein